MNTETMLRAHGFTIWDTGGGCKAWGLNLNTPDERYILVSDDSADIPTGTEWGAGLFNENGEIAALDSNACDLETAIRSLMNWQ